VSGKSRRMTAKAVYHLGGLLGKVKTRRRVYSWDPDRMDEFLPAGRRWLPCRLSIWLMQLSMHLDPEHWDHWALEHGRREGIPCKCGGYDCG